MNKIINSLVVFVLLISVCLGCSKGEYDDESLSAARVLSSRYGWCVIVDSKYSLGVYMLAEDIYAAKTNFNTTHGEKANNYFTNSDLWTQYLVDVLEKATFEDGTRKYVIDEPVFTDYLHTFYFKGKDFNVYKAQEYAMYLVMYDVLSADISEKEIEDRVKLWLDDFDIKRGFFDDLYWEELEKYLYEQISEAEDIEVLDKSMLNDITRITFNVR